MTDSLVSKEIWKGKRGEKQQLDRNSTTYNFNIHKPMTKWGRGANAAAATGSSAARAFRNIAGPGNGKWPIQIYFEWCLHGHSECSSVTCNLESSYLKSCQFDLHIFYNRLWCEPWAYLQISRPCLVVAGQNAASEGKWFGCPGWRLGFPRLWQTLRKTSHHTADPRGCLPSPDFMVSNYCIILPGGKKMSSSPRMGWNISSQSTAIFKSIRKGAEAICSMAFRINCCLSWNTRCSENKMQSTWLRLDGIKLDPCQSVLMQCNWDTTDGGMCPGWGECPLATRTQAGAMLPEWMSAISVTLSHAWHNMKPRPKQIVFLCSACTNMGLNIESVKTAFKFSMCFHKNLDLMVSRFHNCERCNLQNGTFWQMQLRYSVCFHIWNCWCKMPSNCPLRLHSVAAFGLRNCICTFASWRFSRDVMSLKLELKTSSLMRTIC